MLSAAELKPAYRSRDRSRFAALLECNRSTLVWLAAAALLACTETPATGTCEPERRSSVASKKVGVVKGVVFEDRNRNAQRDSGEPGLRNVIVSNGHDVVQTEVDGRYELPAFDEMTVFVSKPRQFAFPEDSRGVPRFYYTHRGHGSPDTIEDYRALKSTGELPSSLDFALIPSPSPNRFRMLALGDTQVRTDTHVSHLRDSLLASVGELEPAPTFAVALGDLVDNTLSLYPRYARVMEQLEIPVFYVPGNHDLNFDAPTDAYSLETYQKFFGPPYYSFDYGQVHFVVLDSVVKTGSGHQDYRGQFDEAELAWLKHDLEHVAPQTLIVVSTHIPLSSWIDRSSTTGRAEICNRDELYAVLGDRKVLVLAGHTHTVERSSSGHKEEGWRAPLPYPQIIAGAVCGSWWEGELDPAGVPFAFQRDGAPKGYMVLDFDGDEYRVDYRTTGATDTQMHVSLVDGLGEVIPGAVLESKRSRVARVVANIWAAPPDADVEIEVDGQTVSASRDLESPDPYAVANLKGLSRRLQMLNTSHLWTAVLPELEVGVHEIRVVAKAADGTVWRGHRYIEVE